MNSVVSLEQKNIAIKIGDAELRHAKLKDELAKLNAELESRSSQISIYERLAEVSEQLEKLHELGAGELFWQDKYTNEEDLLKHVKGIQDTAKTFNDEIDVVRDEKFKLEKRIEDAGYEIAYLKEDLEIEKQNQEDSKNDFVVNRDYQPSPFRTVIMPWDNRGEDEKRFKKYLLVAFLYSILFALIIPGWQLPIPDKDEVVEIPERIAKFIKQKQPKPKPKKETKIAEKKKPSKEATKKARKKAEKSGLLAFKNNFADLLDDVSEAKLGANAKLSKQGSSAKSTARSLVLAQAQKGSGGINSSSLSRDVGGAGGRIGSVKFTFVKSAIGTAAADDRPLSSGPGPSRSDEEIQIVFDKYKAALYRIYNRELRKNPTLQGKMVLRITILPNGKVSNCKIESTDLDSALLSKKIVERVKRFNFGAKKGVPKITILYPIDFLPAS